MELSKRIELSKSTEYKSHNCEGIGHRLKKLVNVVFDM